MAKEIRPDGMSGAARFLLASGSMEAPDCRRPTARIAGSNSGTAPGPAPEPEPGDAGLAPALPAAMQKVKREFVLTRETDAAITEVVTVLRDATSARLSCSHVLRGLARLVSRRLPAIRAAALASGPRKLPPTSPEQAGSRVEFELALAEIFQTALSSAVGRPPAAAALPAQESPDNSSAS